MEKQKPKSKEDQIHAALLESLKKKSKEPNRFQRMSTNDDDLKTISSQLSYISQISSFLLVAAILIIAIYLSTIGYDYSGHLPVQQSCHATVIEAIPIHSKAPEVINEKTFKINQIEDNSEIKSSEIKFWSEIGVWVLLGAFSGLTILQSFFRAEVWKKRWSTIFLFFYGVCAWSNLFIVYFEKDVVIEYLSPFFSHLHSQSDRSWFLLSCSNLALIQLISHDILASVSENEFVLISSINATTLWSLIDILSRYFKYGYVAVGMMDTIGFQVTFVQSLYAVLRLVFYFLNDYDNSAWKRVGWLRASILSDSSLNCSSITSTYYAMSGMFIGVWILFCSYDTFRRTFHLHDLDDLEVAHVQVVLLAYFVMAQFSSYTWCFADNFISKSIYVSSKHINFSAIAFMFFALGCHRPGLFMVIHVTVGRILEDMDAETFVGMETKKRVEKRLSMNPGKISRVLNLVKTEF